MRLTLLSPSLNASPSMPRSSNLSRPPRPAVHRPRPECVSPQANTWRPHAPPPLPPSPRNPPPPTLHPPRRPFPPRPQRLHHEQLHHPIPLPGPHLLRRRLRHH